MKFVTLFAIGGTERQVVNIGKGLAAEGFDVEFGCLHRMGELLAECEVSWPVTEYRTRRLYGYATMKKQMELGRRLRGRGIDIMHAYGFYANVFAIPAARLAGVPLVVGGVRDTGETWSRAQNLVQQVALRLAHHVVVNAEAVKKDLIRRGTPADRVTVIPNGIDCARFRNGGDGEAIRREWEIPPGAPVIGVLARLMPIKGLEYFLQAAALIAGRYPEARFVIVGDTRINQDYREQLKDLTRTLGLEQRVRFAGFRLDIPDVLASFSISVLSSVGSEGLSNALLESMAGGRPVIATQVGGNPEIVQDGVNGLLVPPANPHALAEAMTRLLDHPDLARRFGEAGRERVFTRYSLEHAVAATDRLYRTLLQARAARHGRAVRRAVTT